MDPWDNLNEGYKIIFIVLINLLFRFFRLTIGFKKVICVKYSECVFVDIVIQHANHIRRHIFRSVANLFLPYHLYYFKYGRVLEKN